MTDRHEAVTQTSGDKRTIGRGRQALLTLVPDFSIIKPSPTDKHIRQGNHVSHCIRKLSHQIQQLESQFGWESVCASGDARDLVTFDGFTRLDLRQARQSPDERRLPQPGRRVRQLD